MVSSGWHKCKLLDFCELIMGQSPPSSSYNMNKDGLPFYQGKAEFGDIYPNPVKYCNRPNKIAEKGDLLLSVRAPVGPTNLCPHQACIGRGLAAIRPSDGITSKFLLFLFRNFEPTISKRGTGTTFKAITKDFLTGLKVDLPPLPEQHRIVAKIEELFSDLDNGIENLKQARGQLRVYRQAVLNWAFEGKLTEAWKKEHKPEPAEKLLEQIKQERERQYQKQLDEWQKACEAAKQKDTKKPTQPRKPKELPPLSEEELAELPELPEGWNYFYLAYLGDLARGKSKHRPRNDPKLFGGKYPFIQTGEVKAAKYVLKEYSQTYNDFGLSQSKLWPVNTLCITIAANIAETTFLGIEACFPDSIVGFLGFEKIIDSKYVRYFIHSTKTKIEAFAPATAQKNINLTTLENLSIPYCTLEEQILIAQEIESRLSITDKLEQTIEASLQHAEALRQSILKKAFEGKLVPQDPNDEPAAKLLERIRMERKRVKSINTKKT